MYDTVFTSASLCVMAVGVSSFCSQTDPRIGREQVPQWFVDLVPVESAPV